MLKTLASSTLAMGRALRGRGREIETQTKAWEVDTTHPLICFKPIIRPIYKSDLAHIETSRSQPKYKFKSANASSALKNQQKTDCG